MKNILIAMLLFLPTLYADEFDLDNDTQKEEEMGYPIQPINTTEFEFFFPSQAKATQKEIREFIPLIPRMLNDEELQIKREKDRKIKAKREAEERKRKAKIEKNFANKSELHHVSKKVEKVEVDKNEADFFDSLDNVGDKPVNME